MLSLLNRHGARYLVIGGLAFIYHAKPRYTKDMDLWVEGSQENLRRANLALSEFGRPTLPPFEEPDGIVQIGLAPDRIDLILNLPGIEFEEAWTDRVIDDYGEVAANWISLDGLLRIKERIAAPRHQEDARVLREVKRLRGE